MGPHPDRRTDRPTLRRARYDEFAEWYLPWVGESPGLVCDPESGLLSADLSGQRWLDVACGAGRTSRELARRGAAVIGVDVSDALISRARADEAAAPHGIRYIAADITEPDAWWDGEPFDGAVCEMAFMDIDDLHGTLDAVAQVLRRGAGFFTSLVNPCFPGNEEGLSSWPPDRGYAAEGFWTSPHHNPDGVRIRVGSNHRMLSTYLNAFIDAGLRLETAFEPATPVPTWLVLACRRQ
jgi:SAM-dependent methyltransferase